MLEKSNEYIAGSDEGINIIGISFYKYLIRKFRNKELRMIMLILKRKNYVSIRRRCGNNKKNIASHIIGEYFYNFLLHLFSFKTPNI
jgi:hypothetical protein